MYLSNGKEKNFFLLILIIKDKKQHNSWYKSEILGERDGAALELEHSIQFCLGQTFPPAFKVPEFHPYWWTKTTHHWYDHIPQAISIYL